MGRKHQNRFAWLALGSVFLLLGACSIIAEVDREKLPDGTAGTGGTATGGTGGTTQTGGTGGTTQTGGTGGTTETGGTGGTETGGTGGTGTGGCGNPADCPGSDTECQARTCIDKVCGFQFTPEGTVTSTQEEGDCKESQCDGSGNIVSVNDDTDVPPATNDCTTASCVEGTPTQTPLAEGTACTSTDGKVCDGAGACVECVEEADCTGTGEVCEQNKCVVSDCANDTKDNDETDVDCGGPDCAPCADGKTCVEDDDCENYCAATSLVCVATHCDDEKKNEDETDVDCGGTTCLLCDGDACTADNECKSGKCDIDDTDVCIQP